MSDSGDIILKERYGSTGQEIVYVDSLGGSKVVAVESGGGGGAGAAARRLASVFLPRGYPDSVSADYARYQLWDTAQAFCSTITGTLATQEVLRGVGVGDASATPAAATVTWLLKDGCGHVGRIVFAATHGTHLDAYSKKWRLYADCLNDAAICLEMALPLFGGHTTALLCLTTAMKAVVGVAGGATRAALTQHHALRFNMADVAAKDSAQETAVNLVSSAVALLLITCLGNSLLIFAAMVILHVVCNYFAVKSVCLRTFNEPRFLQTIERFLRDGTVATPRDVNRRESIIFHQIDRDLCGFQILVGGSARGAVVGGVGGRLLAGGPRYAVWADARRRRACVLLARGAGAEDALRGYFHAVMLACFVCSVNNHPLAIYKPSAGLGPFGRFCQTIPSIDKFQQRIKSTDGDESVPDGSFEYEPSRALLEYANSAVEKKWIQLREDLLKTGWNLEKHLLIADEWRLEEDPHVARLERAKQK